MKIPKLFKKAAAFVMAAVTALSIMPATAFAAGDIGTISFSHTYDSNGNAMRYNSSANIGGYTAGGTGNYKYRMFVDGENAFCIQPGVPLKTGNTLKKASSDTWNALSANQKKAVGLALLYGYQGNQNNLSGSDDEKWLATQTLVWEFVTGCREATGSYNQTSTTVYSLHFGSNYANSGARAVYDQIVAMLREHNTIPSFMSGGKNDITKELAYKDGKYSITLNDSNGVLSDYSFLSSDSNVSVSKSGNKLTISSTVAISGSVRITAKRNNVPTVSSSAKLIAYGDSNLQDLVTGVENADTVSAYINIETPTGTIALKKTSEDGVVEGISFTIKGDNFNKTVKTGKDGSVSVEGLFPGTYTVTEQSIDRYEPQKTQTVTLIGGKTSTVTFSNTLKRGSLEIVKTSEDNLVEGMKFHLYGTSLSGLPVDEYAVTDKNGLAKFENVLISGDTPYVVEEVDTAVRYVVPASQTAPIEWNKVTKHSFDNVLKKFQAIVTKTDAETGSPQGNASLAGAVYGIYKGEELIDTYTTDENGQFTTKYYICDNDWTVREISPSEGYLLDTAIHKVGAEPELYTVELNSTANDVNEQVIKGNIALIKHTDNGETQIETPEEGAVFEVFLKSAGSYENAKETERDVLTCDENGFAQTKDMPYGIYTVRQTSGWEGRELMKDFDVFISKDGQTYRYLINNANFESYIKIVKKDAETGNTIPYAGAGFQIYDPNGNLVTMTFTYPEVTTIDTFYTTADGDLITPQTLEYGKGYSLVEVQALQSKQKFISQIMTSKSPVRSAEDVDEVALSFAEVKMLATGDARFKEKMDLDIQVSKLRVLKQSYLSEHYDLEDRVLKYYPQTIKEYEERIAGYENDAALAEQHKPQGEDKFCSMTLKGVTYTEKADAGEMLLAICKDYPMSAPTEIGSYRGFRMEIYYDTVNAHYCMNLCGKAKHKVDLGADALGNLTRIENELSKLPARLEAAKTKKAGTIAQLETAKEEIKKPFAFEDELKEKIERLNALNIELNLNEKDTSVMDTEPEQTEEQPERKCASRER